LFGTSEMSTSNESMTMGLMAGQERSWKVFLASYGAQAVAVFVLIQLCTLKPVQMATHRVYEAITLTSPLEPEAAQIARVRPQPLTPSPRVTHPMLQTTRLRVAEEFRHPEPRVPAPEPVHFASATPVITAPVIKPAAIVTGSFSSGSSAVSTVKVAAQRVQTGGFGDPNGVPAQSGANRGGAAIAQTGSFDMPAGAGYGNGTGGAHGIRGTVASAGFGSGTATQNAVASGRGVIQSGFGDTRAASDAPRQHMIAAQPDSVPVEIVSKPKPVYTDEARQLHIEGEVLVEVVFTAAGQVHALRVVRGLGHGLDEAALRAAEQIRFKPAQRDGHAVDSTAVLHVVFQIA
jgi:TonB family protein